MRKLKNRMNQLKIAILYQSKSPPEVDGIVKPMKESGYSDSGADIAFALQQKNIGLITRVSSPNVHKDYDWVFPDSENGIKNAIEKGANLLWLNTVLYSNHPVLKFIKKNILIVGQEPNSVEIFDDKFYTNTLLKEKSLPIASSYLLTSNELKTINLVFPLVVKPVRGRGSQGVIIVQNENELQQKVGNIITSKKYGNKVIVEEYLPGKEITITIMPPGNYTINNRNLKKDNYWALPPVERFNHVDGIAPYNGIVAVINNSKIISNNELKSKEIKEIANKCELAANILGAKAPIRIDCRKNKNDEYLIFDLNMKPNMTGASRPHRKNQDSLTMIAAKGIGWTYSDLILNILSQNWKLGLTSK